jgi:hypothetical protein
MYITKKEESSKSFDTQILNLNKGRHVLKYHLTRFKNLSIVCVFKYDDYITKETIYIISE